MRSLDPTLTLNAEQQAAVRFGVSTDGDESGPLLVLAGAGTGKTGVLAHRVAHLVKHGVDRDRILLLTFTRLAAAEMTQRVGQLIGGAPAQSGRSAGRALAWSGTFHSVGLRLLRTHATEIGLDPAFTIHDAQASVALMKAVREALPFANRKPALPDADTCQKIYSFRVNSQRSLEEVLSSRYPLHHACHDDLTALFKAYRKAKRAEGVVDFDDLLLLWLKVMKQPTSRDSIRRIWDHVLVDEYQDTNTLQAKILKRLKPTGAGLTVVGDDAQAIYGFRAANVANIRAFAGQFTPPATEVALTTNYRSTAAVLDAANAVIDLAPNGIKKALRAHKEARTGPKPALVTVADDAAQARYVVDQVLANNEKGISLGDQAVLFRVGDHGADIEAECRRRNVAFVKLGGNEFVDRPHVVDLLAALSWAENPKDRTSATRVLVGLPGIGPATAKRFLDGVKGKKVLTAPRAFEPPPKASKAWADLVTLMSKLRKQGAPWPKQIKTLRPWIKARFESIDGDADHRGRDIDLLLGMAATFNARNEFLENFALDPSAAEAVPSGGTDRLVLSTIHGVKGGEFEAVFVINAIDGAMPINQATRNHPDLMAEERRLLYVAMTRAKRGLTLVMPKRSQRVQQTAAPLGGTQSVANRTRFITKPLLGLFDEREIDGS